MSENLEPSAKEAFEKHLDRVTLTTKGKIVELLEDDNEDTPHQRFVLSLPSGQTLLILNNLDRAYRLPVEVGQNVEVRGQYRWNRHGGLVHETHHDDRSTHEDGWIILTDINKRNSPEN